MRKIALITGINGQDGAYLAQFLLKKKYKVIGTHKSNKPNILKLKRLGIEKKVKLRKMDLGRLKDIQKIFNKYKINEVYNLASQSYIDKSFYDPIKTSDINAVGVLRLLETIRSKKYKIKFYQASSSEMFGNNKNYKQSETSRFDPQSPYAVSKLYGHFITKNYRESYNIFAVSGILFNHESPLRDKKFVTSKVIQGLIDIKNNKINKIKLGNINIKRDWGYSKEYVAQMWKMMQLKKPNDYIIATGKAHSLKKLINIATKNLGMKTKWKGSGSNLKLINKLNNKVIILSDKKFFRPSDVICTRGDISKAKKDLNWKPKTSFNQLVNILIKDYQKKN